MFILKRANYDGCSETSAALYCGDTNLLFALGVAFSYAELTMMRLRKTLPVARSETQHTKTKNYDKNTTSFLSPTHSPLRLLLLSLCASAISFYVLLSPISDNNNCPLKWKDAKIK